LTGRNEENLNDVRDKCTAAGLSADKVQSMVHKLLCPQIILVIGDISSSDVQKELIESAVAKFGSINVLVNNAGMGSGKTCSGGDMQTLQRLMEVNVYA